MRDRLLIEVPDLENFFSAGRSRQLRKLDDGILIPLTEFAIPPQNYLGDVTENLEFTSLIAGDIIKSAAMAMIILDNVFMNSLQLLWCTINGLQIVSFLMLLNLAMPANVLLVYGTLYEIAVFNFVPTDFVLDWFKSMTDE